MGNGLRRIEKKIKIKIKIYNWDMDFCSVSFESGVF